MDSLMDPPSSYVTPFRRVIAWAGIEPLDGLAAGRGSFGVVFKGKWKGS